MCVIATITEQSGNDLSDYQVRIEITDSAFFEECTDRKFIECYFQDGSWIPHYTEEFDPSANKAVIWVKVPSIPANGTVKVLVKVNPTRTEDLSDGEAVFDFFGDFEDADISDWEFTAGDWQVTTEAAYEGDYGLEEITTNPALGWGYCQRSFSLNELILEYYARQTETAGGNGLGVFSEWNGGNPSGYVLWMQPGDNLVRIYRVDSGSSTLLASGSKTLAYNKWYKLKLAIKADGTIEGYVNDELVVTATDTTYTAFSYVGVRVSRAVQYDLIVVRKYIEPEPSVTVEYVAETVTYSDYFYWGMAKMMSGAIANFMQMPITMEIYANDTLLKTLSLKEINTLTDTERQLIISVLKFEDDSSDSYQTDKQIVYVTDPDGNTRKLAESTYVFIKIAELPLLLGFEIHTPYEDSQMML